MLTPRISTIGQLQPITGEEVVSYEMGVKLDLFNSPPARESDALLHGLRPAPVLGDGDAV